MDDFESDTDEPLESFSTEKRALSSAALLEEAIDSMAASDGACFNLHHYHSFKGVSILLPLRTCAICSRRLQVSVAFSNMPTVQCAACGILLHRTCAFSKTSNLDVCPVNYPKVQAQNAKQDMTIFTESSDNQDTKTLEMEIPEDLSHQATTATSSTWMFPLSHFATMPQNQNNAEETQPQDGELKNDILEVSSGEVNHRAADYGDTSSHEKATSQLPTTDSIFRQRPPSTLSPSPTYGAATPSQRSCETIRFSYSEDGIIHSQMRRLQDTRANFPFLSSASLLQSRNKATLLHNGEELQPAHEYRIIQQSRTWHGVDAPLDASLKIEASTENSSTMSLPGESSPAHDTIEKQSGGEEKDVVTLPSDMDEDGDAGVEWTADGPPVHWANQQNLQNLPSRTTADAKEDSDVPDQQDKPLHFASHPFASVSQALHQHILFQFRPMMNRSAQHDSSTDPTSMSDASEGSTSVEVNQNVSVVEANDDPSSADEMNGLLKESKPKVDRRTNNTRLGLATVAGGIAGGVAGMVFAGPVGGVIGAKFGQTAGILGLALEGSVTIGVITSGIAAGTHAGQQLQDKLNEDRVLTLSGDGVHRTVLLVRPSIQTDPDWADIYCQVRQAYPTTMPFNLLMPNSKAANRERYEREVDIVKTDEDEIPTEDKVLLLVSRILNDKESLPGFVYRELLDRVKERADERGELAELSRPLVAADFQTEDDDHPVGMNDKIRARRRDTHAVIKYVTATLLEVRPGFAASTSITELTATAVEGLVFGGLYDMVIEEIETEYEYQDNALLEKIAAFEKSQADAGNEASQYAKLISKEALESLRCLPEAHSAVDKLRYCVSFLERISAFFAESEECQETLGADSLLKMVCQHIIVAKVFCINAQVAFLDEFARDEQLLRGKEGYALVTLQASLHFLNACKDIEKDIFAQDDDHDHN